MLSRIIRQRISAIAATVTCLLSALVTPANASDEFNEEFFGEGFSSMELQAQEDSLQSGQTAIEALGAMTDLLLMQLFADGRCEGFLALESEAKQGNAKSQFLLSDLYRRGLCVPQNDELAFQWVSKAARNGYASAYHDLGVFLLQGIGTQSNPRSAKDWLEKAVDTRPDAYYWLAKIYLDGKGAPQNYVKAHAQALSGAEYGDPRAQSLLALLKGVSGFEFADQFEAYKWALIARSRGTPELATALADTISTLKDELSPEQVSQAQKAASEWQPKPDTSAQTRVTRANTLPSLPLEQVQAMSQARAVQKLAELELGRDRYFFFKAIAEDNVAIVALFLRAGASPETTSPTEYDTALLHAARHGSSQVAEALLDAGADIDRSVNSGNDTPVLLALSGRHREVVDLLIARGAAVDHPGIMYNAVEFDDSALLALLVAKGVPIDTDYVGTPLSNAVHATGADNKRYCLAESVGFLIAEGADLSAMSDGGTPLLQRAIYSENPVACVEMLLSNGAGQDAKHGKEPLFLSLLLGNDRLVELLLQYGADPNLRMSLAEGWVPFDLEGTSKSLAIDGGTVLHIAVAEQHYSIAKLLVEHGAKTGAQDNLGRTPISLATESNDELMLSILQTER